MKKTLITLCMFVGFGTQAVENGQFINKNYDAEGNLAPFFKSFEVNTEKCHSGGAVIKFYGADAFKVCLNEVQTSAYEYKKCMGKEIGEYPFGKVCLGVNKKIRSVTTKETSLEDKTLVYTIVTTENQKVTFEEEYRFTFLNGDKVTLQHGFKDHRDGRGEVKEISYEK